MKDWLPIMLSALFSVMFNAAPIPDHRKGCYSCEYLDIQMKMIRVETMRGYAVQNMDFLTDRVSEIEAVLDSTEKRDHKL